jgi:hypothetical protein
VYRTVFILGIGLLALTPFWGIGQKNAKSSKLTLKASYRLTTKGDTINRIDRNGKAQGPWIMEVGAYKGEDGYLEYGNYEDGLKEGTWRKLSDEDLPLAIETYRRGVLNGEVKYYTKGRLTCVGHYRGLNPLQKMDTIWVEDAVTGAELMRVIETERGSLRHGQWLYYDELNGRLLRQEEYQVDDLIASRNFESMDSAAIQKRIKGLPHNDKHYKAPPLLPTKNRKLF